MGKGVAWVASLAGIAGLGFLLWRGERERATERVVAPVDPSAMASALDAAEASAGSAREPASEETPRAKSLRGRVLTAEGAPLAECEATLSFLGSSLATTGTDADGRFELAGPLHEGTVLELLGPDDWDVQPEELELDALPEEELAFVATRQAESAEPMGLVRGVAVDEVDGTPLPYLAIEFQGESLETDAEGRFESEEEHEKGTLWFRIEPSVWSIEMAFDPTSREPLVVPARVGPTVYVSIGGKGEELGVLWTPEPSPPGAQAFALETWTNEGNFQCSFRREAPALVRLPARERARAVSGELYFYSPREALFGRADLTAGAGTRASPVAVSIGSCAYLSVEVRNLGRDLVWYEELEFVLSTPRGEVLTSVADSTGGVLLAVLEPGERVMEVRFEGELVAQETVQVRLGEWQPVKLTVNVPATPAPAAPEVELVPVSGRVTSARNRPTPGRIRFARASDREESQLALEWTKTQGRWVATFAGEAPAGELRATLEMEPCFGYSGPRELTLPSAEELVYALDDAVPFVDVYLAPVAAEDGTPLLSYTGELHLDDGSIVGGKDYGSPSVPLAVGHPSNVPFHWLCISGGRMAASGRYEGRSEGGEVRIPVPLARGWGAFLYVGDPNYEPIEGAEIFLDGVRHTVTGPDGYAALAGARPSSITVQYRDWQIEDGEIEPDGTFDDSEIGLTAYLAPPAR